jgi:hypothetical protein
MNENLKDQDVLLVKEKNDNDLKVVKGIDSENGKLDTVAPNLENQPDFMKIDKNGNVLDNFLENFSRQFKNPTEFMFFKIPADKVEETANNLQTALKNPETPENKQLLDAHKVEVPQVKKEHAINPDLVDWKKFENFGITRESLEKSGSLDKLLDYQKTNLLPVAIKLDGENLYSAARFSLRKQEDGRFSPAIHLIRHKSELERPYFGVKFTEEDKTNLLTTGNLGRVIEAEFKKGEKTPVLISLDKQTNELVAFRTEWLKVPDTYKGVQLNEEQKQKLSKGKAVKIDGMISTKGKEFSANVQFNADKRYFELIFDNDKKQSQNQKQDIPKNQQNENKGVRIPTKILGVDLTKEQQNELSTKGMTYAKGMTNKEGKVFDSYIVIDKENGKLSFFKYNPNKKEKQADLKMDASQNQKENQSQKQDENKQQKSKGFKI